MIIVNIISSGLLLGGTFIYKYIFPKKKINLLILLLLFSILPVVSMLRPGDYESGDFNIHVYRSISFYNALSEGQLLPTWSKNLNATFGYPTFIVGAPLTYYSNSLFHFLGLSFIDSMKATLALAFVLSGIAMFFWAKEEFGKKAGFAAAIFYLYAPFHLVDLHFRVSPGDTLAYLFLPLSLYGIIKLVKNSEFKFFALTAISIALLMLSHPISLVAMTFIVLYLVLLFFRDKKTHKNLLKALLAIIYGLILSSFYWLSLVLERSYFITSKFSDSFSFETGISAFLYSPWRFGLLFQGPKGELSYLIGYIQLALIILTIIFLIKKKFKKEEKIPVLFYLVYFTAIFFLFLPVSEKFWNVIPFYKNLQFTNRLMFIMVFLTAAIAGIFINKIKKNYIIVIIILIAVFSTILNWGHRRVIPEITDSVLNGYLPKSTYLVEGGGPAAPVWVNTKGNPWEKNVPKSNIEVLRGNADIKMLKRLSINHEYIINAKTDLYIKENTYYFPDWTLAIDNKIAKIDYTNKEYPGIITFNVKKGLHKIDLNFYDTPVRRNLKILSFILLIGLIFYPIFKKMKVK